jgi:hypothetical protein
MEQVAPAQLWRLGAIFIHAAMFYMIAMRNFAHRFAPYWRRAAHTMHTNPFLAPLQARDNASSATPLALIKANRWPRSHRQGRSSLPFERSTIEVLAVYGPSRYH